ncbi:MAG: metal-dependent transcriptional regulator, partial [Anaerolineae bacterium]|nr:metal-dependent transcriptional regulator [Anaerolineae bacterium]
MTSTAMRRYAAEIYRIQQDEEYASLTSLSEHMDVSLQAASRMIRRMKDGGMLEHEPYKGVQLTPAGERLAMPALRRHRLSELYLVRQMGFDWADVHALVDDFERGVNELIEDRMDAILDHPTRCPHGEPIPDKQGVMPPVS